MNKKQKLINTLNNHFNSTDEFLEISQISEEDMDRIISLYEKEASKDGRDPWSYLYFDDLIIMQRCVYEVIKDVPQYEEVTDKVELLFEKELNRRLERTGISYGEVDVSKTYTAPYTDMQQEALVLAEMCIRKIQKAQESMSDSKNMSLEEVKTALSTYESIKDDFVKAGIQMPAEQEQVVAQTKEELSLYGNETNDNPEVEKHEEDETYKMLQEDIDNMNAEISEIKERLRMIVSETVGSYFSKQLANMFPEEQERFEEVKHRVKNHFSNAAKVSDIVKKYNGISDDLMFYRNALNEYENYYKEFLKIKEEMENSRNSQKKQETSLSKEQSFISGLQSQTVPPEEDIRVLSTDDAKYNTEINKMEEQEISDKADQHEQDKKELINSILSAMIDAGEFKESGIDISQKLTDIENTRELLETKSVEMLRVLLSSYMPRSKGNDSTNNKEI